MPRVLLLSALLLAALAGCQVEEGRWRSMSLGVEARAVSVRIGGRTHGDPRHLCPPSLSGIARVNGIAMEQVDYGGGEPMPDSDEESCLGLWWSLDLELLPPGTETLDVTFDTLFAHDREYTEARDWHVAAAWIPAQVWTEDDLTERMRANEEFEVRWEPPHAPVPEFELGAFAYGNSSPDKVEATITRVRSEPGSARFRFDGPEPDVVWDVIVAQAELQLTHCSGFERCAGDQLRRTSLQPGGIAPTRPDGVAPPRACIAPPGALGPRSGARRWSSFPDLSLLHIPRRASCDGPDLYFVLLGSCGVCGGGSSTFIVGNRGTQPGTFTVRSNRQSVKIADLEPQQRSTPFELLFDGALSPMEIVSDSDCDTTSNTAWVESDPPECS